MRPSHGETRTRTPAPTPAPHTVLGLLKAAAGKGQRHKAPALLRKAEASNEKQTYIQKPALSTVSVHHGPKTVNRKPQKQTIPKFKAAHPSEQRKDALPRGQRTQGAHSPAWQSLRGTGLVFTSPSFYLMMTPKPFT